MFDLDIKKQGVCSGLDLRITTIIWPSHQKFWNVMYSTICVMKENFEFYDYEYFCYKKNKINYDEQLKNHY